MRKYLIVKDFTNFPDGRCLICKQHEYLLLDYMPKRNNMWAMHSYLEDSDGAPVSHWIHWWCPEFPKSWLLSYPNFNGLEASKCLQYYKEIKI